MSNEMANAYKANQLEVRRLTAMCEGIDSILHLLCREDRVKVLELKLGYVNKIERLIGEFN